MSAMTTFWIIYIVLELTAAVLFTVGRLKKNDKILKPGLIFCAAAMIAFFICIKEPFSGDPWALDSGHDPGRSDMVAGRRRIGGRQGGQTKID